MSEENKIEPVIAPTAEAEKAALDPEIAKIVNSAVTAQLKRLIPKAIEQYEAGRKQAEPVTDPVVATPKAEKVKENPEFLALQKRLDAMTQKARNATLQSALMSSLEGKVSKDWLDVAVEKLASKAVFSADDEPSLKFGDDEYSVSDGVLAFLSDPSNKRFIPAPTATQTAKPQNALNRFQPIPSPQNTQAMDPLSDEYLTIASNALRAQGGLLGGK